MLTGKKLRIGVCGVGSIGSRHARLLGKRSDVDLYLCDAIPSRLDAAKTLGNLRDVTDAFEQMMVWPLDGIVIATPNRLHVDQGIAACRRGIALLVEKPVTETVEQGKALLDAVRETGVPTLVGYVLRYAESMRLVRELLDQSLIGTVVSFQVMLGAYDTLLLAKSRFSPADRNKLFVDYSHEWDYIAWFLGPVRSVVAASHRSGDLERTQDPNVVDCILELESRATGTVHLDYVQYPSQRRCTIIGDRGTLEFDVPQSRLTVRLHGEAFARQYQRIEHRDAMMERQLEHFVQVVHGDEEPLVPIEDGLRALAVAEALIRSCESRGWEAVDWALSLVEARSGKAHTERDATVAHQAERDRWLLRGSR